MNKSELKFVHEFLYDLSHETRKVTLDGFKRISKKIKYKDDFSPVTKTDLDAEKKIRNLIKKNFPHHNIYGEEIEKVDKLSNFTWVLDPIDGTKSFVIGRPLWATMVALMEKENPIISLVDFPCNCNQADIML